MTNHPLAINPSAEVWVRGGGNVCEDGERNGAVRAAGQSLVQMHRGAKGHLDLPLTILYHTLPLTPSSASVAFTFMRKEKQRR